MTKEKQEAHFKDFVKKQEIILLSKGDDYATENRLSNFSLAGGICGLTPEMNCLSLIATKVARLGVLLGTTQRFIPKDIYDAIMEGFESSDNKGKDYWSGVADKVSKMFLTDEKSPKNESIRDSVIDLANYAVLLDMIISEKNE